MTNESPVLKLQVEPFARTGMWCVAEYRGGTAPHNRTYLSTHDTRATAEVALQALTTLDALTELAALCRQHSNHNGRFSVEVVPHYDSPTFGARLLYRGRANYARSEIVEGSSGQTPAAALAKLYADVTSCAWYVPAGHLDP